MGIQWQSILKSVLVVIPAGIFLAYTFSFLTPFEFSETLLAVGISSIIAIGVVYNHLENTNDSESADDRQVDEIGGADTEEQEQTAEPTDEDTGESKDSGTPADELSTPDRQSSLLRSNEQIIEETEESLGDRVVFHEDGDIKVAADDLNLYSEMMLYVIGKWIAYHHGLVNTATITVEEIGKDRGYTRLEGLLFLNIAGSHLKPSHRATQIDYAELNTVAVEVNPKKLPASAEWAIGEEFRQHHELVYTANSAKTFLASAKNDYEIQISETQNSINESERSEEQDSFYSSVQSDRNYDNVKRGVISACTRVSQYPVEFGRDSSWGEFVRYADSTMKYLIEDEPTQISHCLKRMDRRLETLEEKIDEKYDF